MESKFLVPVKGNVLLVDGSDEKVEGGVIVSRSTSASYMDFVVARVSPDDHFDFGQGDRVLLDDPYAGRRIILDGAPYRLVSADHIMAVLEG